jgi:predicted nucleic acid-binding protein
VTTAYLDASALVKLALKESESAAVQSFIDQMDEVLTSRIGIIETRRAVTRSVGSDTAADVPLSSVAAIELDAPIAATAALLGPAALRTLDAIHIATALTLYHLDAFVTYDDRLADAAQSLGLPVASPT